MKRKGEKRGDNQAKGMKRKKTKRTYIKKVYMHCKHILLKKKNNLKVIFLVVGLNKISPNLINLHWPKINSHVYGFNDMHI